MGVMAWGGGGAGRVVLAAPGQQTHTVLPIHSHHQQPVWVSWKGTTHGHGTAMACPHGTAIVLGGSVGVPGFPIPQH